MSASGVAVGVRAAVKILLTIRLEFGRGLAGDTGPFGFEIDVRRRRFVFWSAAVARNLHPALSAARLTGLGAAHAVPLTRCFTGALEHAG